MYDKDIDELFNLICTHPECIDIDSFKKYEPSTTGYIRAIKKLPKGSVEDKMFDAGLRSVLLEAKFTKYHWRLRILAALMDDDDYHTDNLEIFRLAIKVKAAMKERGLEKITF